ncbi:MAG: hypothetical protein TQ37_06370, partial [Candidatus Synechococcus spongiarum 15L]
MRCPLPTRRAATSHPLRLESPSGEALRSVPRIAQRQQIPAAMLEQILLQLRHAGLVVAQRGRAGGYGLAQPASSICLEQVAD